MNMSRSQFVRDFIIAKDTNLGPDDRVEVGFITIYILVYWVSNGPGPEVCGLIAGSRCEGGEDRWLDGEPLPETF